MTIHNEDCLISLARPEPYAYIITSPPDLDEIGIVKDPETAYRSFLSERFRLFKPTQNVVTIIQRDRKMQGTVLQKHNIVTTAMRVNGWVLKSQKIWVRSYKANLYRFNYSFIQTYKKQGARMAQGEQALPDVFYQEVKPIGEYVDNYPVELVEQFIKVWTEAGEVVCDPFMGSGSTALAAKGLGRKYTGSEIDPDVFKLCGARVLGVPV